MVARAAGYNAAARDARRHQPLGRRGPVQATGRHSKGTECKGILMAKEDLVTVSGQVEKILGGGRYLVALDNNHKITAQLSGRMRRFHIRVITGDRVQCGVSPASHPAGVDPRARAEREIADEFVRGASPSLADRRQPE